MKEPNIPDLDLPLEPEEVRAWIRWAHLTIGEMGNKVVQCEKDRTEAMDTLQVKEKLLGEQAKAIQGLKDWVNLRKDAILVYEPGKKVILQGDFEAIVETVFLRPGNRIEYSVYWWRDTERNQAVISSEEIVRDSDLLPLPNRQDVIYR